MALPISVLLCVVGLQQCMLEEAQKLENEIEDALKELSIPGEQAEAGHDITDNDDTDLMALLLCAAEPVVAVKPAGPPGWVAPPPVVQNKFGVRAKARTTTEPEPEPSESDVVALHYQDDFFVHEPLPVKEYEIPSHLIERWEARKKKQIPESISERLDAVRKLRESTALQLLVERSRRLRFQKCFGT